MNHVKIKCRAEVFGASPDYFDKHIKDKKLKIVKSYNSMLRVEDENGEVWSVFNGYFVVV